MELELPALEGVELDVADRTWTLTGSIAIRNSGTILEAEARQAHDVRGRQARIRFGVGSDGPSLNPSEVDRIDTNLRLNGEGRQLTVQTGRRTYDYELRGIERT